MIQIVDKVPDHVRFGKAGRRPGKKGLPFDKLEVGQSFLAPAPEYKSTSVRNMASQRSIDGKRFSVAKTAEGYWVTRTA